MAYDGIVMALARRELHELLQGARVEKIYQPHTLEIVLHLRTRDAAYHLMCSADTQAARVHLTKEKPENPSVPPAFCMLLRKHLTGARLLAVEQQGLERVLTLTFRSYDDFGNTTKKSLVCELMGKHSNLILTMPQDDGESTILGSIKTVDETMSRYRVVMPGEPYFLPPSQDKLDLFTLTEEELAQAISQNITKSPDNILVMSIMGIGKDLARDIVKQIAAGETLHPLEMVRPLAIQLHELARQTEHGKIIPFIVKENGEKLRLALVPPAGAHVHSYPSVNETLDVYYTTLLQDQKKQQWRRQLEQTVTAALGRAFKKRQLQEAEISEMEHADTYRIWGELLTASLYQLRTGMTRANVPNYYADNTETIEIPLNPAFSPQENAQRYFKKYRKLRDGYKHLTTRLQETNDEIAYLESLLLAVEHADMLELHEVREEMEAAGLIRRKTSKKTAINEHSLPLHFISPDGIDVYVGKNNRQNDTLTMKTASGEDVWLHVKNIPGSHVIVKNQNPPESTLLFAAELAAAHSKAKASANVPVDYTKVKYVKKLKGAKPGMVIYTHQKTLFVTPSQNSNK